MNSVAGLARLHLSFYVLLVGSYARVVVFTWFISVCRVLSILLYMIRIPSLNDDVLQVMEDGHRLVNGAVKQLRARSCFLVAQLRARSVLGPTTTRA